MKKYSKADLAEYLTKDYTLDYLNKLTVNEDENFTCQKWLRDSGPKRMIFWDIYGDLLTNSNLSVLDIGGGYTSFTREFVAKHNYHLVDIMTHDDEKLFTNLEKQIGQFWVGKDWSQFQPKTNYDLVIANDIFPNVDQRLRLFIETFLPFASELRITATYYNEERCYTVKRVDADEIYNILAWGEDQVTSALFQFKNQIQNVNFDVFSVENESIFPNKRQVVQIVIKKEKYLKSKMQWIN